MAESLGSGSASHTWLAGVRVVALEQAFAGPICTRHLADLGADVIKVERPGSGDFARQYDSVLSGDSAHFAWLNWGKRSITLDAKSEEGRDTLTRLVDTADVLVSNLGPGAVDRLLPHRRTSNERLIDCTISAFSNRGSYSARKGYDMLVQAEAGVIKATGTRQHPAKPGVSLADLSTGIYSATAICAALRDRDRTGLGTSFSISLFDVVAEWMSPLVITAKETGAAPEPAGVFHASIVPYGPYETLDGPIIIAVQNDGQWHRFCEHVLGDASIATDSRFATNEQRVQSRSEVDAVVRARFSAESRTRIGELLDTADVPWAYLNAVEDVPTHPELVDRWQDVRTGPGTTAQVLSSPFHRHPVAGRSVPQLGEHTAEILRELETDTADPD